jgi:cytochrome P450
MAILTRQSGGARTPPGPRGLPVLGSVVHFRRDPLNFLLEMRARYGDFVRFRILGKPATLVNDPGAIKELLVTKHRNFIKSRGLQRTKSLLGEGLLTSEGEFHLRQRRLVQPAFHRQRIASYAADMVRLTSDASARWEQLPPGEPVDIAEEMTRLTLAIVAKTLFDADVEEEAPEIKEALDVAVRMFFNMVLPFTEYIENLPLPSMLRLKQARQRLDETIYRIIRERRESGEDRGDLLSMLLMAMDEEGDGKGMTDKQVRDEAMTLFLAGHETTANALSWTWYLLAQHPEVEARLHEELDTVLQGRSPTFEDLERLTYTRMVLSESMRLYPPAWILGRIALEECELGGHAIPAGSIVLASQYLMHHDERYYPEPFHFDPLRWTEEAQAGRPKFAYFPFGGGPRLCIGESFAWMEGTLVLATLAQRWRPRLLPGRRVEPQPLITLRPRNGIPMRLEQRK